MGVAIVTKHVVTETNAKKAVSFTERVVLTVVQEQQDGALQL